jgi:hypothetical protein
LDLEKPIQKAAALVKKIVAPFQSILDRIMRFIQFTLLGYFVDKVLKWFADPANERKIKVLGRFLKDWWPALLTAYGLFATPFGLFVRSTLKLLRGFIPQMARFIAANPYVFGAAAVAGGAYAASQMNEQRRKEFKKTDPSIVLPEETAKTGKTPGIPQLQQEQMLQRGFGGAFSSGGRIRRKSFFGGGAVDRIVDVNDIAFEGGGGINDDSGLRITGAGPDTQLIAAQPGEVMISKKAVDKYGANFFLGLNKRAGGTNIPRMVNNIQLAQGGGMIGRVMAPRTGGQTQWAKKGARSVFQMFGMNVPGTERPTTYSSSDVSRYNRLNPKRSIQMGQSYTPSSGGGFGVAPTIRTMLKNTATQSGSFVRDSFRNFGSNVQTIKGAAQRQENMMREMGVQPSGYVNLRGQPINLGPQLRSMAPGTPVISSKTQMIVLPPTTSVAQKPATPTISGTQIPEFSIVANTGHRSMISDALGIADLVG